MRQAPHVVARGIRSENIQATQFPELRLESFQLLFGDRADVVGEGRQALRHLLGRATVAQDPGRFPEQSQDVFRVVRFRFGKLLAAVQEAAEPWSLQVHIHHQNVPAPSRQRVGHIHDSHAAAYAALEAVKGENVWEGHGSPTRLRAIGPPHASAAGD